MKNPMWWCYMLKAHTRGKKTKIFLKQDVYTNQSYVEFLLFIVFFLHAGQSTVLVGTDMKMHTSAFLGDVSSQWLEDFQPLGKTHLSCDGLPQALCSQQTKEWGAKSRAKLINNVLQMVWWVILKIILNMKAWNVQFFGLFFISKSGIKWWSHSTASLSLGPH